jgi:hypothetical protein
MNVNLFDQHLRKYIKFRTFEYLIFCCFIGFIVAAMNGMNIMLLRP